MLFPTSLAQFYTSYIDARRRRSILHLSIPEENFIGLLYLYRFMKYVFAPARIDVYLYQFYGFGIDVDVPRIVPTISIGAKGVGYEIAQHLFQPYP